MEHEKLKKANSRTARKLALVTVLMIGFGYALVPLYNVFCDITGLNGKVNLEVYNPADQQLVASERWVEVIFDANVQSELPWSFTPEVASMKVRVGEPNQTSYMVRNIADYETTGQAIPSVAPGSASKHMRKMECFCFARQSLAAGEERDMPLSFVISPQLPEGIKSMALSYTFFNVDTAQGNNTEYSDNSEEG